MRGDRGDALEGVDRVDVDGGAEENFIRVRRRREFAAPREHLGLRHEPAALDHHRLVLVFETSLYLRHVHLLGRSLGKAVHAVSGFVFHALSRETVVKRSVSANLVLLPLADPRHDRQMVSSLLVG